MQTQESSSQETPPRGWSPRVAIVGTGFVGSTAAYALLMSGVATEIVMVDRDKRLAEGHVQDLRDAEVFTHGTRVFAGDFGECSTADVIIITAGASQAGLKSRLDDLKTSAAMLHDIVREIMSHNPQGILLIASNPVDVLTYAVWKWSGLPTSRVIGSGTSLDTARFRRRLAYSFGVASDNVHAYIIGEHGDSQIPVASSARIAGVPLDQLCRQLGLPYDEHALEKIAAETRTAGIDIIGAKGATYYGIGAALTRIVRAIFRDEHAVITVSSRVPESTGLGEVSLSLPAIINRQGIARVLEIPLSLFERRALEASAATLKSHIAALDTLKAPVA